MTRVNNSDVGKGFFSKIYLILHNFSDKVDYNELLSSTLIFNLDYYDINDKFVNRLDFFMFTNLILVFPRLFDRI